MLFVYNKQRLGQLGNKFLFNSEASIKNLLFEKTQNVAVLKIVAMKPMFLNLGMKHQMYVIGTIE